MYNGENWEPQSLIEEDGDKIILPSKRRDKAVLVGSILI